VFDFARVFFDFERLSVWVSFDLGFWRDPVIWWWWQRRGWVGGGGEQPLFES
jgi:hypothetical protein